MPNIYDRLNTMPTAIGVHDTRWMSVLSMIVMTWLVLAVSVRGEDLIQQAEWDSWVEPAQAISPDFGSSFAPNERRVRVRPRNGSRWQAESSVGENGERIVVIDSGVNIMIYNVGGFDTIDISTDRVVVWTTDDSFSGFQGNATQPSDVPLEFYMEGNIVFRQGERIIYADRMYYNVREESGVILNSEMLSPMAGYPGVVRLKAEVLRQVDQFNFEGNNAGVTTSRMGVPRYWLQTGRFTLRNTPRPKVDELTGLPIIDPKTGKPRLAYDQFVTSRNNRLYLGSLPVFFWPSLQADLSRPTFYLSSFSVNNDRVFGTQVLSEWNLYQIFGVDNPIQNSEWTASLDYLSERGLGFGSRFNYDINGFLNRPGRAFGFIEAWGINDGGLDNLGLGRRALQPEEDFRGRVFGRHRHDLPGGFQFNAEVGVISDRNFQEQYYEEDWDELKDATTGVELKRYNDNRSWSITGDVQANDFFTTTEWLPRLDHFWIGESIFGDWLTWHEHSNVGYGHVRPTDAPLDPADLAKFDPLAWEVDAEGIRAVTRHEVSLPFNAGPVKVVPYALGEAGHWGEDISGQDVDRLYGQLGVRSSLPMFRVDPTVRSQFFNLNGLAHKLVWEAEFFFADANEDLGRFPLYDPLDDDAIEFFRRRFFFDTFNGIPGGDVNQKFDERFYALRSNLQGWVSSPNSEIADDLMAFRLAAEQRWQTKRGLPGNQHIVDWVTLNLQAYVYPDADRDNFGQELGLVTYDFKWHPGDRFTVLSDGHFDLFGDGLKTFYLGAVVTKPTRGRYAVGFRSIEGPISSQILFASTSYRISQKWIANYGSSYDFGKTGNLGQTGQIIRVGESFLVGLGFQYDSSRDNLGVRFAIEPRFLSGRLGRVGGVPIPPVGILGLE